MSAPEPFSYRSYPTNGTNRVFAVPFPYILRAHVQVGIGYDALSGDFDTVLAPDTGFTWVNNTSIQTTVAPAAGQILSVVRTTPIAQRLVDWQEGSAPTPFELDVADLQVLYVVQEQLDKFGVSVSVLVNITGGSTGEGIAGSFGFERVANVAALPTAPEVGKLIEVVDTTGIQSAPGFSGVPVGFVGEANLSARIVRLPGGLWGWLDYKANDPDARYLDTSPDLIVEDVLTSTSTTNALSANMGRVLDGKITASAFGSSELLFREIADDGSTNPYIPAGTIIWLRPPATPTAPPPGFRYANGSLLSRAAYPELFAAIGTSYGAGDGSTTFGTPLEASLTNPFGDTSYKPFYKVGLSTSLFDNTILVVPNLVSVSLQTYNLDGLTATARSAPNVQPGWTQSDVALSLNAEVVAACNNSAASRLYAAKRTTMGWEQMTFSSIPAEMFVQVAVNNAATLLVAVSTTANYVYTRTGDLTWGSPVAYGGPAQTAFVQFSHTGQYLTGTNPSGRLQIWKVDGSTITFLTQTPTPGMGVVGPVSWSANDQFLIQPGSAASLVPRAFLRSGDTFSELFTLPRETPNNNNSVGSTWINASRSFIAVQDTGGIIPAWQNNNNGTFSVINNTGVTAPSSRNLVPVPGSDAIILPSNWSLLAANGNVLSTVGTITGLPTTAGATQELAIGRTA